jgi:hypothetical protein
MADAERTGWSRGDGTQAPRSLGSPPSCTEKPGHSRRVFLLWMIAGKFTLPDTGRSPRTAVGHVLPVSGGYVELFRSNLAPTATGARSLHILKKSRFREAKHAVAGHDQVIQHTHIDQRQRSRDAFGDELVGLALIFYAARMVMKKYTGGSSLL